MSEALTSLTLSPAARQFEAASGAQGTQRPCAAVDSTDILRGNKAVEIQHNGLIYRLQATRLGKLILTK
ncbi:MAG: hemin uptake protein HemP [Polaromonas sp.]|nr:hemin uptake protein HemP [Polaromonas sp.]MDP3354944.1 hemin uptake protein HemP [Polaromonas sp.]MDP3753058.1 hemin uptake protein HemP [Polaromonas sp.]